MTGDITQEQFIQLLLDPSQKDDPMFKQMEAMREVAQAARNCRERLSAGMTSLPAALPDAPGALARTASPTDGTWTTWSCGAGPDVDT